MKYEKAEAVIIEFECEDVIAASDCVSTQDYAIVTRENCEVATSIDLQDEDYIEKYLSK